MKKIITLYLLFLITGVVRAQNAYQTITGDTSGYTPGNFNVTDGGASSYSIPIIMSPGSSGMQPSVSIAYSSQGGNGLMGLGWSLQGLSAITRAEQTLAQDGQKKGLTFTSTDRYALDGERIIVTDLGVTYGSNGAEYRTEQNAFSKIISYGNVGGGVPQYFKVWSNSGLIMEYGNSNDSRIEIGNGSPAFWLLNKVTDTKGNFYTISYQEDAGTGGYVPLRIDYTGNQGAGIVPYASIQFEYESRPDSTAKYLAGFQISSNTKRLKAIKSFYGSSIVRSYLLNYQISPANLSQLIRVQECGSDGRCHTPTTFDWKNLGNFNFYPFSVNNLGLTANDNVSSIDLNGDGVQDLLKVRNPTSGVTTPISCFTSNKDQNNLVFQNTPIIPVIQNDSALTFCDFNGDGKTDILQYGRISGGSRIYLNTTQLHANQITFNSVASPITNTLLNDNAIVIPSDFNSDGRSDLLCFNPVSGNNYWLFSKMEGTASTNFVLNGAQNYFTNLLPNNLFNNQNLQPLFGDFNSDGLVDIIFWNKSSGVLTYYENNGGASITFTLKTISGVIPSQITGGSSVELFSNDINSDGLPDLFYWDKNNGTNLWWINKGNNSFQSVTIGFSNSSFAAATTNADYLLPLDFNADGLTDYVSIFKNSGQTRWIRNDGGLKMSWVNFSSNTNSPELDSASIKTYSFEGIGNFTSRSMMDMLFLNKTASPQIRVMRGINEYNNLISKINVGSGQSIAIAYEFLTSDSVYEKRSDAVYPLMDYQATQFVVRSYSTNDGIGGMRAMDYKFIGAKMHLGGRGFRGYSEVHMTDRTTGIVQSKYYVSDAPSYKYMSSPLARSIVRLGNGVAISVTDYENTFRSFYQGRCNFSYTSTTRTKNYEIDVSFVDSTITTQDFDDYGNVIRSLTNYGDGFKDSLINLFDNNPSTWIIGRLTRSDLYRTAQGGQTVHKASAFQYDLNNSGLLLKEITEPDSTANVRIEKTYTYDAFGNILESATTAWNGTTLQTRKNTTQYDPLGRFIISAVNDIGHVISKTYDPLLGLELTITDQNGLIYTNVFDGFGRKIKSILPDGNWSALDYRKCGNGVNCPPLAYHVLIEQSSANPKALKYYDLYNKELRSEKKGFNGNAIYQDNEYDNRGLLERVSNPYYSNESPIWTNYQYDISGRNIVTTYPGNRVDSTIYKGRTTVYVNPKGQHKTIIKNTKEQLLTSRDQYNKDINYQYDARGNLLKITDPKGNEITMSYDIYGNKTAMNDPDMGNYTYVYNRFGELIKQIDPKGHIITVEYDILGRMTKRTEPEGITIWTYDSRPNGKGLPATVTGLNGYSILNDYDNLSRKTKETQTIAGVTYTQQYTYDTLGRTKRVTYPTGFAVENDYNTNGYLYRIRNPQSGKVYWQATTMTAREQLTSQQYGNGLTIDRIFDVTTNYLTSIDTKKGSNFIQRLGFNYDEIGNLTQRTDVLQNKQEDFEYDALNRLIEAKVQGGDSLLMQYDELGNIISKSDVGTYHYGAVNNGPHQLQSIDLTTKQCIPSLLISTDYTSFNKVKTVTKDSTHIDVFYNADRQRNLQKMYVGNNLVRTKIYVSPIFEKEIRNGDTTLTHFIKGPEGTIAVYLKKDSGQTSKVSLTYLHRDHLGSVIMVTSDTGAVVARYSYDAWGKRRNSNWTSIVTDSTSLANDRGFTGHEHYDLFDLIDMNGRIYDPVLARFLSPDPFIQDPTNLQSLNRYSYVVNNPLSLVDPSGHFFGFLKKIAQSISNLGGIFKMIGGVMMDVTQFAEHLANVTGKWCKENWKTIAVAAIAITAAALTVITMGGAAPLLVAIVSGAAAGFASSVSATLLNGGNIGDALKAGVKGAAIGAVTAAATFGVGSLAGAAGSSMGTVGSIGVKTIGHGVVQGTANLVQGGKFSHGFFSGAVSGSIAPSIMEQFDSKIAQVAISSVAGGTTSAICGGKFANGAVTGAFVMMYNEGLHDAIQKQGGLGRSPASSDDDGECHYTGGTSQLKAGADGSMDLGGWGKLSPVGGSVNFKTGEFQVCVGPNTGMIPGVGLASYFMGLSAATCISSSGAMKVQISGNYFGNGFSCSSSVPQTPGNPDYQYGW